MDRVDITSADGTSLATYRWAPAGAPRANVVLVHGLAEHMGRYGHVASALTGAGFAVTGLDLRGHGHSDGKRGHVSAWQRYVEDVMAAVDTLEGGRPWYLMAHSMGGLVALDAVREGVAPQGLLLTAPLLGVLVEVPLAKRLVARVLSRVAPSLAMPNDVDPDLLTHDPAVNDAYRNDPLVFRTASPRWYRQMRQAIDRVTHHAADLKTPMLMAWGTDDRIVDPLALAAFCQAYGGPATAFTPHGLYHEVLNEPGGEVMDAMLKWLEGQLAEAA